MGSTMRQCFGSMRARQVVLAMALGLVGMAWGLERFPLAAGTWVGRIVGAELTHLVAHAVLYGSLAVVIAVWWFPPEALDEERPAKTWRALGASLCFALVATAQELTQALSRGRIVSGEEIFDLSVDAAGACLGLIAWATLDARRRYPVARALGVLLHPGFLGPIGVFALTWSALESTRAALGWTLLATLAVVPVAGLWLVGLHKGWFADRDLSVRSERPVFLLASLLAATALAVFARSMHAPAVVQGFTRAGLVATVLVTIATVAGLKVSGHVAVPVGVMVLLQATSYRGPWPFLLAALALSWARVREGRHSPREVLGAWGIAGASGAFARWVA